MALILPQYLHGPAGPTAYVLASPSCAPTVNTISVRHNRIAVKKVIIFFVVFIVITMPAAAHHAQIGIKVMTNGSLSSKILDEEITNYKAR